MRSNGIISLGARWWEADRKWWGSKDCDEYFRDQHDLGRIPIPEQPKHPIPAGVGGLYSGSYAEDRARAKRAIAVDRILEAAGVGPRKQHE